MFENKKTTAGINYSRYIASWLEAIMDDEEVFPLVLFDKSFREWLKSEGCIDDEIHEICQMARCGKYELTQSAKNFLSRKQNLSEKDFEKYVKDKEEENKKEMIL